MYIYIYNFLDKKIKVLKIIYFCNTHNSIKGNLSRNMHSQNTVSITQQKIHFGCIVFTISRKP